MTERKRILIVDDEDSIRKILNRLLKNRHDITEASTAEEGYILATSQKFDLIITDHDTKSKMTGLETTIKLREKSNNVLIIIHSSTHEALRQAPQYNATPLYKPADNQEIIDLVSSLIG